MKAKLFLVVLLVACVAQAKERRFYQKGQLAEMTSVSCGYDEKGGKSFSGTVLGTDAGHKQTREMLCQEYLLKSERVIYRIRPKEEKHPALLPVGEDAEFRIEKDKMKLRVPEGDDKEREYLVISMTPRPTENASKADVASTAQK